MEVMKRPLKESGVIWDAVELLVPRTQFTVWSRDDGTPCPNLDNDIDLDDLYPEETITKQFWKSKYTNINQWLNERISYSSWGKNGRN